MKFVFTYDLHCPNNDVHTDLSNAICDLTKYWGFTEDDRKYFHVKGLIRKCDIIMPDFEEGNGTRYHIEVSSEDGRIPLRVRRVLRGFDGKIVGSKTENREYPIDKTKKKELHPI